MAAPGSIGNLEIEPLFPVALGQVQMAPDLLQTARQMQAIHTLRGQVGSNPEPGCAWTGDLNGVGQLHRHPVFAPLIAEIAGHAWGYLQQLGFDPARVALHIQRCWPVVSEAGQVVGRHHHPNAHLSAVVYLNGDGSGRHGCLRLWPHRQVNELVPGLAVGHGGPINPQHRLNQSWTDVAPCAGLLLLFPSSVDHAVLENELDDDPRVSVSIDFALTARRGRSLESGTAEKLNAGLASEYLAPHPMDWMELEQP